MLFTGRAFGIGGVWMHGWLRALASGGLLVAAVAWGQNEQMGFDPVLKTDATLDSMLLRAGYEQTHHRCEDAGLHVHAVLAVKPDWAGAATMLLVCDQLERRLVDEQSDLSRLISLQPDNWVWWQSRAKINAAYLDWDRAIADITRAIALRPRRNQLYVMRMGYEERKGDFAAAFADAEQIHRLLPEDGAHWEKMAELAIRAGKSGEDERRYRAMAAINPVTLPVEIRRDDDLATAGMSTDELMLRAGYALRVKKWELELSFLNAALVVDPKMIRALEMRVALAINKQTGVRTAMSRRLDPHADLDKLIQMNPQEDYYGMRASLDSPSRDMKSQLRFYTDFLTVEPYLANLYASRAGIEMDLGMTEAAIGDYRRAIDLDPGNAGYYGSLAFAFAAKKDVVNERMMLDLALVGDPDNVSWQRERAKLQ
jgi:tetratricopeptide (TPR) repeat protein